MSQIPINEPLVAIRNINQYIASEFWSIHMMSFIVTATQGGLIEDEDFDNVCAALTEIPQTINPDRREGGRRNCWLLVRYL